MFFLLIDALLNPYFVLIFGMDKTLFNLINQSKVVVFDFDNTMASTEKYAWKSYEYVLKEYNIELTDSHIKKYIGNPDDLIISEMEKDFDKT